MNTNEKLIDSSRLLLALIIVSIIFHIGIFRQPIIDWDEHVYMYLSKHMTWGFGNYSTAGSFIERNLPQDIYKSPVFHHPPLFPFLVKIVAIGFETFFAAKILNIIFIVLSIIYIYMISKILSGTLGAYITTCLWIICPIFNLESYIVHLDFPLTVFVLMGIAHFLFYQKKIKKKHLILSGIFFSFAMLTKYTGPVYVLIPSFLVLYVQKKEILKNKNIILYGGIVAIGFTWWGYIFIKFGSLMPQEFIGGGAYESGYLVSLAKRQWYHIWIYFLAICPLFILYLYGIGYKFWHMIVNLKNSFQVSENDTIIVALNMASILCVLLFNIINMISNNFWVFRHIMPFFPVCYITIGYMVILLIKKRNPTIISYVLVGLFFTLIAMSFSTYQTFTMLGSGNLKPVPAIMFLIPGISKFFY